MPNDVPRPAPIPRDPGPRGPGNNHVVKHPKGPKGVKHKGKKGPKYYGGNGNGFKGVNVRQLNRLVNSQLQQIMAPIRDEKKGVRREANDAIRGAENQYQRATGDLNHIFGETGSYISSRNADTAAAFDTARNNSTSNQAALIAQLGLNSQAGGVDSELGRLGISGDAFAGGANADQQFAGMLANQQGANQQGNLDLMASAAGGIGNLLLGMNSGSQASALGQALNNRNDTVTELRDDKRDALADINDALREARGQRRGIFQELLQSLLQTNWGMYVDQRNLNQQQQQINMQRQAQKFAQRQAGGSGGSSGGGGGYSSGGSGGSSGGGGGGKGPADYYSTNNNLMLPGLTGGKKPHKGKGKK